MKDVAETFDISPSYLENFLAGITIHTQLHCSMKIECNAMDNIETAGKAYHRSEENRCHEVFKAIELTSDLYKNKPTATVAIEGIAKLLNDQMSNNFIFKDMDCTNFFSSTTTLNLTSLSLPQRVKRPKRNESDFQHYCPLAGILQDLSVCGLCHTAGVPGDTSGK
jgi:hypothetical protein